MTAQPLLSMAIVKQWRLLAWQLLRIDSWMMSHGNFDGL
jgi:hypothetical protein